MGEPNRAHAHAPRPFRSCDRALVSARRADKSVRRQAQRRQDGESSLPPRLYKNRHGLPGIGNSLVSDEPAWETLLQPDRTGFRGLLCSSLTFGTCDVGSFSEAGFNVQRYGADGVQYSFVDSDIVAFESGEETAEGLHEALMTSATGGNFPPNCLFKLRHVVPAGQWEAPGGVYPQQRLLVVSATYRPPRIGISVAMDDRGKLCGSTTTLHYSDRTAFVKGLDDLLAQPLLSMRQEFERELEWVDWKGTSYTAREEVGWLATGRPPRPLR